MQDGATVHLTEDGTRKIEVPDDHMVMHVHVSSFRKKDVFPSKDKFQSIRGIDFHSS